MNSVYKIIQYSIWLVVIFAGLFVFAPKQADACTVLPAPQTRLRTAFNTNNFVQPDGFYNQNNEPFVYMDVALSGCEVGESLYLHIFGLRSGEDGGDIGVEYVVKNYQVTLNPNTLNGFSQAFRANEKGCFGDNTDQGNFHCLMLGMITSQPNNNPDLQVLKLFGSMLPRVSEADANDFKENIGQSQQGVVLIPNPSCVNFGGYKYLIYNPQTNAGNCSFAAAGFSGGPTPAAYKLFSWQSVTADSKLVEYYNTNFAKTYEFITTNNQTVVTIATPGLAYNCDGWCNIWDGNWQIVGNPAEYGSVHATDNGPTAVSFMPPNYESQYVPLAPLPFEGLDGGQTPTLPAYLRGLFNAMIIVIIVLAVIMIVFAGVTHFFSTSATGKEGKRELALNAVIGLLIALGSWLLLNTISPELAANLSIQLPEVSIAGDVDSFPSQNVQNSDGSTITGSSLPTNLGLQCPLSGGVQAVPGIIESFENKVTYRFGGKGSPLPANAMFPLTPNESSDGQYMCGDVACRTFCPDNSVCLDCSGFTNQVRRCAGLPTFGGTSSMVNNPSAIAINPSDIAVDGQSININDTPYNFQPGDLLVYNGHVLIYYQNGQVAESRGDMPGIQNPNSNIRISDLTTNPSKNKLTHLIKANP